MLSTLKKRNYHSLLFCFIAWSFVFSSCQTVDLYERVVSIPKQEWPGNFKPQFKFYIKDTAVPYKVFVVLRHNEKYNYNNIWLNIHIKSPGDTVQKAQYELTLATSDKGWLGTAMDDLYEHTIALTPGDVKFYFKKPGEYIYTIEQIMREDPLKNVLNVGIRIEKQPQ